MPPRKGEARIVRPCKQLNVRDAMCGSPAWCSYYGIRMHDWEQVDRFRVNLTRGGGGRSPRTWRRHDRALERYLGPRPTKSLTAVENPVT